MAEIINKTSTTILKLKFTDVLSTFFSNIPAITAEAQELKIAHKSSNFEDDNFPKNAGAKYQMRKINHGNIVVDRSLEYQNAHFFLNPKYSIKLTKK